MTWGILSGYGFNTLARTPEDVKFAAKVAENLPSLMKTISPQIQDAEQTSSRINTGNIVQARNQIGENEK